MEHENNDIICHLCGCVEVAESAINVDVNGETVTICADCNRNGTYICYECGELRPIGTRRRAYGENVCEQCLIDLYYICEDCGGYIHQDDDEYIVTAHDAIICQSCYDDNYHTCYECGQTYHYHDITIINSTPVCDNCRDVDYFSCDRCDEWEHYDNASTTADGDTVCEYCLSNHYTECVRCGEYHRNDELYLISEGNYVCPNCLDEDDDIRESPNNATYARPAASHELRYMGRIDGPFTRANFALVNYTYNQYLARYLTELDDEDIKRYYGIEIEASGAGRSDRNVNELHNALNDARYIVCKGDASVNNGIEVVTMPSTLNYLLDGDELDNICDTLQVLGYGADRSCGLHIHVSRASLATDTLTETMVRARILWLVERFKAELKQLARRETWQYCRFASDKGFPRGLGWRDMDALFRDRVFEFDRIYRNMSARDRYLAVNLGPSETIEFRLFGGTIDANRIRMYVDVIDAIVETARNVKRPELYDVTFKDVINPDTHFFAANYIYENNLIRGI